VGKSLSCWVWEKCPAQTAARIQQPQPSGHSGAERPGSRDARERGTWANSRGNPVRRPCFPESAEPDRRIPCGETAVGPTGPAGALGPATPQLARLKPGAGRGAQYVTCRTSAAQIPIYPLGVFFARW
jgi:hypothetical protein